MVRVGCDKPATSACTAARKKVRDTKGKFTVKEANENVLGSK